jgi:hypothetical protein
MPSKQKKKKALPKNTRKTRSSSTNPDRTARANEGEKPCSPRGFRSFLGMEQDLLRKTVRNQSVGSLDNFVITKNKEQSIQFPEIRLIS